MNFREALELLKQGSRIATKKDFEAKNEEWLILNDDGFIYLITGCWNSSCEIWQPTPDQLIEYIYAEWIDLDDCVHHEEGEYCELCI